MEWSLMNNDTVEKIKLFVGEWMDKPTHLFHVWEFL